MNGIFGVSWKTIGVIVGLIIVVPIVVGWLTKKPGDTSK